MAEALRAREAALDLWRQLDHLEKVGHTLRWLSRLNWFLGRGEAAGRYADQAVELLSTLPPGKELAMAYSNRSQVYMLVEDTNNAMLWGDRAIALAEQLGDVETLGHALNNVGTAKILAGQPSGERYLLRSLDVAKTHKLDEHVARAYTNLVEEPVITYDHARAERHLANGIDYCDERDLDSWGLYMRAWRARERLNQGDWARAEEEATSVLNRQLLPGAIRMPALIALSWLRVRRGDPGVAALLDEVRDLALPTGEPQRIAPVMAARAEAAWLRGDLARCASEALVGFNLTKAHANPWPHAQLAYWLWRSGAAAEPLPSAATPFTRQMDGDWQGAADEWERLGCPYERALALLDGNAPAQRAALDIFERLGAQPAAEITRRKLRDAGTRGLPRGPRATTRANPAGLTNRQLEILQLLVAGLRNTEIAERLFASPKTVDHHVSAVLAKLGARSRAEATIAARALGLTDEPNAPRT
jgi:DNA-binding CsgD family transcriptional regulator